MHHLGHLLRFFTIHFGHWHFGPPSISALEIPQDQPLNRNRMATTARWMSINSSNLCLRRLIYSFNGGDVIDWKRKKYLSVLTLLWCALICNNTFIEFNGFLPLRNIQLLALVTYLFTVSIAVVCFELTDSVEVNEKFSYFCQFE